MPKLPETQKSLLVRLAKVDHETVGAAWTTFLSIYEPAIFRFALSRGLQDADARDVTQQVLLAVHQKLPEWELDQGKGSFRGWLFMVARNLASKKLRTKRRQAKLGATPLVDDIADQRLGEEASVFFLEYRKQVFQWAANSIKDQFQTKTWEAFWRTSVDGEAAQNVAEELGISLGAVYAGKCRIMANLREMVEQMTNEEFEIENGSNEQ